VKNGLGFEKLEKNVKSEPKSYQADNIKTSYRLEVSNIDSRIT
jgi:hypothetical protein